MGLPIHGRCENDQRPSGRTSIIHRYWVVEREGDLPFEIPFGKRMELGTGWEESSQRSSEASIFDLPTTEHFCMSTGS